MILMHKLIAALLMDVPLTIEYGLRRCLLKKSWMAGSVAWMKCVLTHDRNLVGLTHYRPESKCRRCQRKRAQEFRKMLAPLLPPSSKGIAPQEARHSTKRTSLRQ